MIRAVALVGFVLGFALVLAAPLAIIDAMLQSGPVAELPTLTSSELRLAGGIMIIGLLLSLFSAVVWLASEGHPNR